MCHIWNQVGIVVARKADNVGDDTDRGVLVDEEGIGFPIDTSEGEFPFPVARLRSLALLA